MKSFTSLFRLYAASFLEGPPDEDLHWFTMDKKNGNFYFAGETKELCINAAKEIVKDRFYVNFEEFPKFKD